MNNPKGILVFLMIVLFFPGSFTASQNLQPLRVKKPPVIDGIIADNEWKDAPSVEILKTFSPDFGKSMSQKTIVYMSYDSLNLYFAYKCYDSNPELIKATITSRDNNIQDDWVCINLDTFGDNQSLYALYANPFGIQSDSRYSNSVEDFSYDMVWFSAGTVDEEGYNVEFRIPLKSIRYSDDNPVNMSVFFERYVSRTIEHGSYPEFNPSNGFAIMTQMKPIIYSDLEHYKLVEIIPAVTYNNKYSHTQGELKQEVNKGEFSLTAKYGITSDLILDGTYNPDFSQVEADAGQVDINLRYSLFFSEKRPFFLEGAETFKLGATQASELDPIRSVVHTRNIFSPVAGMKLTGKLNKNLTIASIYAADDLRDLGLTGGDYAHFAMIRAKHALSGDSYLGGIYAGREFGSSFNRLAGIDGMIRPSQGTAIEFNGLLSFTKNDYFPQAKGEYTFGLRYGGESRDIDYSASLKEISKNFNDESGYITRTGISQVTGLVRPKIFPDSKIFRRLDFEVFTAQTNDKFYDLWETFNHASLNILLPGNTAFKVKYSYSTEIFLGEKFKTGGYHIFAGSWLTKEFYAGILYRKIGAIYYSGTPYQGRSNRITASVIYHPSDKFSSEANFIYFDFTRDSDNQKIYEYPISYLKLTYQFNKYLLFRGIVQYNNYYKELLTDLLASFTYIPGTVVHLGYGSLYDKIEWQENQYRPSNSFLETRRGIFLKVSYLWRN